MGELVATLGSPVRDRELGQGSGVSRGPKGPASRDLGPQRPVKPHEKAEDTKQPANDRGEER